MSAKLLGSVVDDLRSQIQHLYALSYAVGFLDMMVAFAGYVTMQPQTIRPTFDDNGPIAIRGGVNPMSLRDDLRDDFVPFDYYMHESSNLQIITGPNGAGKSTYLKTLAILTIMAHLGCYVPAEFACFRPINRIYTRFRTSDSIEEGASTFFIEMREMAQIEQGASMGSLVLVDELGRGTSITDGVAIAWAFCEHIINTSALTLFTTHYHQLTQLARVYPTCKNLSLFCEVYCPPPGVSGPGGLQSITNEYLRPSHEVCRGPSQLTKGYGITMASMAGFPDEIIQDSKTIYEKLSEVKMMRE
eukprot:GHVL01007837.1.p1 GENE.GHVL01007837.1~~GHVL01007837.1.p1  ORF type:complete len:302 (-),score=41.73 GHVL01007837.1:29-934(-)